MKESERLRAAKRLIDSPEKWMQGEYGDMPFSLASSCKLCSVGAVLKARGEEYSAPDLNSTSKYLLKTFPKSYGAWHSITDFNDEHSHEEVMQMFDKAIEIAESEEN